VNPTHKCEVYLKRIKHILDSEAHSCEMTVCICCWRWYSI